MSEANVEQEFLKDSKNATAEGVTEKTEPDAANKEDDSLVTPLLAPAKDDKPRLKPSQLLLTSKHAYATSLWACRMCVLADSVTNTILRPNYPFMVLPRTPDNPSGFPSTEPFEFSAAQYFIPMTSQLGTAIAAIFVGSLSDRIGRRPCLLTLVFMGAVGSVAKYFCRNNFWAFCAANFCTGLFGATVAVAMAYASDVAHTRLEKDAIIGSLVGISMVGATGGGIITIAMSGIGIFEPLLVGAGLNLVVTLYAYVTLIEPDKLLAMDIVFPGHEHIHDKDEEEEEGDKHDKMNWPVTFNILVGALLDNAGSTGFIPFCLSPLMFTVFFSSFVEKGQPPIMSEDAFRWISTLLALMIIPAAASSTHIYGRIGAAGGCVWGNFMTGIMTIVLLQLSQIQPTSTTLYGIYVALMYAGFPLTVLSQLSTGPMLDRISPPGKKGFVQGLNTTIMNFGMAVSPWVFGMLADTLGINTTIWICIGISFLAAVANAPLMFVKEMKPKKKPLPEHKSQLPGEDKDLLEKALRGEWVPPDKVWDLNNQRMRDGHDFLVMPYRPYAEDKTSGSLCHMKMHSEENFKFWSDTMLRIVGTEDITDEQKRQQLVDAVHKSRPPVDERKKLAADLGQWFADYMFDAGYQMDLNPVMFKQFVMSAFPRIMNSSDQNELTMENIEAVTLRFAKVYNHFHEEEKNSPAVEAFARAFN